MLLALVVLVTKKLTPNAAPLSFWEAKTAQWYLMNAVFIHFLMDGLSVFRGVPELHDLYYLLDARYKGDPTVDMLSLLELGLMAPMCIALYYAVHARAAWRHPMQLMTSAVQLFGTLMYVGTEVHSFGGSHWIVDYHFEFTFDHLVYFWFCVIFGMLVWIIVPLVLITQSTRFVADAVVVAHRTAVIPATAFRSLKSAASAAPAVATAPAPVAVAVAKDESDAEEHEVKEKEAPRRRRTTRK